MLQWLRRLFKKKQEPVTPVVPKSPVFFIYPEQPYDYVAPVHQAPPQQRNVKAEFAAWIENCNRINELHQAQRKIHLRLVS